MTTGPGLEQGMYICGGQRHFQSCSSTQAHPQLFSITYWSTNWAGDEDYLEIGAMDSKPLFPPKNESRLGH